MTGHMITIGIHTMHPVMLLRCSLRFAIFPITLSCWQFVEILQWCNHFFSALFLVYLRKLVSVYSC